MENKNNVINLFMGDNLFLSNFYYCDITYKGITYKTSEAAFQAQKCPGREKDFIDITPLKAKRLGKVVELRKDWESIKDNEMYNILQIKFAPGSKLAQQLIDTGDAILMEGTYWHDTYWGIDLDTGMGKNKLGKILMQIREQLVNKTVNNDNDDMVTGLSSDDFH